jgi:hypothetical protein
VLELKNGEVPVKKPRRRDIAPTGELAGLPARDAPKSSAVLPRIIMGEAAVSSLKKAVSISQIRPTFRQIASGSFKSHPVRSNRIRS